MHEPNLSGSFSCMSMLSNFPSLDKNMKCSIKEIKVGQLHEESGFLDERVMIYLQMWGPGGISPLKISTGCVICGENG